MVKPERTCWQDVVRKTAVAAVIVGTATLPLPSQAQQSPYPNRVIRFVVPFPAGGPVDIPARLIAQRLSETMGQQVLIDNRGGASARIGTEFVAKAPRDGYTVLFNNSSHTANVSQFRKLPYDTVAHFTPITQVNVTSGNLMVIHPSVPAHTVKELIALAKARPNQLNYASSGVGAPIHVASALFVSMAGIQMMHVPYKSTVAGLTDVLGGRAELMVVSPTFRGRIRQRRATARPRDHRSAPFARASRRTDDSRGRLEGIRLRELAWHVVPRRRARRHRAPHACGGGQGARRAGDQQSTAGKLSFPGRELAGAIR
ncbi:MAG TPA: tripartite tricarboxylate transporter substrate-binding protein [Burkholderiales bacterium]|nr:tripartite tricarboxylate transporter substrate-binding protein [Burkholderiales bacterium]